MSEVVDIAKLRAARQDQDPDFQAGSLGLTMREVVHRYFHHVGELLVLLRHVHEKDISQVATETGIATDVLQSYESGARAVSLKDSVALAGAFQVDLRVLMEALGNVKADASGEAMGIAAQFTGDLTEGEKLDLKKTMATFIANRGKRGTLK